ncbi:MAG: type II toxin-antitoxin system RelE/ParE family toxin [Candidatus Acidiferrum sp.]
MWTRPALRDLEAIGDFIARDNRIAAAKIFKHGRRATQRTSNLPAILRWP